MAIVEINHVESAGNSGGWDWKSLLAVLFGFLLKLATDELLKYKDRKKVAEIFENELDSYKDSLKKQAEDVVVYLSKTKSYDYSTITVYFTHKFDLIKSLDKVTLVKYYKKRHKGKLPNYVNKIYNNIELLQTEFNLYEKSYREYSKLTENFQAEYKSNLDAIRRTVALYCDGLSPEEYKKDVFLLKFAEINNKYIHNVKFELKDIVNLEKTFHFEIFKDLPTASYHVLYNSIFESSFKGKDMIQLFTMKTDKHVAYLKNLESSIKEKYKDIYKEELILGAS